MTAGPRCTSPRTRAEAVVRGCGGGAEVNRATDEDPPYAAAHQGHEAVVRGLWRRGGGEQGDG